MDVDIKENESEQVVKKQNDILVDKESEVLQLKAIVVWREPSWKKCLFEIVEGNKVGEPVREGTENVDDPSMDEADIAVETVMEGVENLYIRASVEPYRELGEPGMDGFEKLDEPVADKACETARDGGENLDEPAMAVADIAEPAGEGA